MKKKPLNLRNLAVLGGRYEKKLNELIKDKLNNHSVIDFANSEMKNHVKILRHLRQLNEDAAQALNLPTKEDIANVAKLNMQLEEKLDKMDAQLSKLLEEGRTKKKKEKKKKKHKDSKKFHKQKNNPQNENNGEAAEVETETENSGKKKALYALLANPLVPTGNEQYVRALEDILQRRRNNRDKHSS
ncbi:hypothetical protein [Bacillus dakarensis]|uniref:hypothetical protein n=1 Tax=Robertmurraya dakarensis TaxID=1926278 RepID=UPI000980C5E8|nr:hypothetical protein [Bacillus dakarensis]